MRRAWLCVSFALLAIPASAPVASGQERMEPVAVRFSNPAKPGMVSVEVMNGSILVQGYDGKDVLIATQTREKRLQRNEELEAVVAEELRRERGRGEQEEKEARSAGMKRLEAGSSELEIEEEDNVISVSSMSEKKAVDVTLKVPMSVSLELTSQENGEIRVENVTGEIEAQNLEGPVTMVNIGGTVVCDSMDGDVKVSLTRVTLDKPMSFSTMDGDIDVTLPADIKATLRFKTTEGDVFTDFDIDVKPDLQKVEEDHRKDGGKYRLSFERAMMATVNGGGPELTFVSYDGDIYIRKKK